MDGVVTAVRLPLPDPLDFGNHGVEELGKFLLGQFPGRACQDVMDADAGTGMFDGGLPGGRRTREDLHLHAKIRQRHGQRPDVDIHAAGIARTRLLHGGSVE